MIGQSANDATTLAEAAERDRDELLKALGFKPGPLGDEARRAVILQDAAGLRPAMVDARRLARELVSDAGLWQCLMHEDGRGLLLKVWQQRRAMRTALQFVSDVLHSHEASWLHDGDDESGAHDEDCRACEYQALLARIDAVLGVTTRES